MAAFSLTKVNEHLSVLYGGDMGAGRNANIYLLDTEKWVSMEMEVHVYHDVR